MRDDVDERHRLGLNRWNAVHVAAVFPVTARIARLGPVLVVALATLLGLRRFDNTDTWWHLAGGRWIVEHGAIPYLDPLSSTVPDKPWINVQWLFDVAIYLGYQLGGPSLLVVLAALSYGAATALMVANVRRHVGQVATTVLCLMGTLVAQERFAIRPETVTFVLLQLMLWLYATGRRADDRRLWCLPIVMAIWANCHSLFSVGAVVIACQIAGTVLGDAPFLPAGWRTPVDAAVRRRIVASGIAALAATVLNPFLMEGATFPFVLISRFDRSHPSFRAIGEFQPPFSGYFVTLAVSAYQVLFVVACTAVAAALVVAAVLGRTPAGTTKGSGRATRRRKGAPPSAVPTPVRVRTPLPPIDLADVAVFVGVAYLSVLARRNMALFAMAGLPCFANALAVLAAALPDAGRRGLRLVEQALAVAAMPVALGLGVWIASNGFYRWSGDMHETGLGVFEPRFPIRASAFVKAQGLPGPWFNDLTTGGYLTWDRPIPGGVYVDGRLEVYDAPFLDAFIERLKNPAAWQQDANERGLQTAMVFHWWPNMQPLVRHLTTDSRWALVYYDDVSIVAVRRQGNEEVIARAAAAAPAIRAEAERAMLDAPRTWQFPVAQARSLEVYANVLATLGRGGEAQRFRAAFAAINARPMFAF